MSLNDVELYNKMVSALNDIEIMNDRVAPTNLRHYVSETVVSLRNELNKFTQDIHEGNAEHFYPEKHIARQYIDMLHNEGYCPEQDPQGSTDYNHIMWMLYQITNDTSMTVTKRNRWLGFIQGVFVKDGRIDIKDERDKTRSIFKGK